MSQKYNIIYLSDGKHLDIPNFNYDTTVGGWQRFSFNNCIPYLYSGINQTNNINYTYIGKDLDNADWFIDNSIYYLGSVNTTIKDSLSDNHGGVAFYYYNESNNTYRLKSFTKLDSKSFVYINGINYLNENFTDATTDHSSQHIFYNFTIGEDFCNVEILTDNLTALGYSLELSEQDFEALYPYSASYYESLDLQYTDYPEKIDNLIFFQDIDLYKKQEYGNYLGYLHADKLAEGASYLDSTRIDYYGAPLLNLIEQRLYAVEYFADYIIGEKPKLNLYHNSDASVTGLHYISDN